MGSGVLVSVSREFLLNKVWLGEIKLRIVSIGEAETFSSGE